MTDKPLTIAEYQRAAMRTANSNPAAADPVNKLMNAVLGIIGEGGEIAKSGILSSRFTSNLIDVAIATGEIADAVKKHYYHGHQIDPFALSETLNELTDAAKWTGRALQEEGVGKAQVQQGHKMLSDTALADELGDLLWYIALAADAIGVPLEEIAQRNVEKLRRRYPDGFDAERSINRS